MAIHAFNPIIDRRWGRFLSEHPDASIFHTREWLQALHQTYGYKPIAFSTLDQPELKNAVVFCEVRSVLTGRRLVSLPFSDHCQPLASMEDITEISTHIQKMYKLEKLKYVEIRPLSLEVVSDQKLSAFNLSERFCLHKIDLHPELDDIYKSFHDSCIRRKIKRAERENLVYEKGRSKDLQAKFRSLLLLTRRRHKLPPQPPSWIHNMAASLGDMFTIHMLSKDEQPIASILTLQYKSTLTYKYGCSDSRFTSLGATPFLFWKVIKQGKIEGINALDLGRSAYKDVGLITFKEHLGATSAELAYYRNLSSKTGKPLLRNAVSEFAGKALVRLPDSLFSQIGKIVYRHIG